jgi:hypothetical protein
MAYVTISIARERTGSSQKFLETCIAPDSLGWPYSMSPVLKIAYGIASRYSTTYNV